jgi:hypothetical protein
MNTVTMLLLNLVVVFIALESDIGRRKIGRMRVFRPLVTALLIVPFFFKGIDFSLNGMLFEMGALAVGLLLGLAALRFMRFEYDAAAHRMYSRAGWGYLLAWLLITGLKIGFSYGSANLWGRQLFTWMASHGISVNAFTAGFIFLNLAMMLSRCGVLYFRGTAAAKAGGASTHIFAKVKREKVSA